MLLTREGMAGEGVTPGHEMPPTYRPGKEEVPTLLLGPSGGAAGDACGQPAVGDTWAESEVAEGI